MSYKTILGNIAPAKTEAMQMETYHLLVNGKPAVLNKSRAVWHSVELIIRLLLIHFSFFLQFSGKALDHGRRSSRKSRLASSI